MNGSQSTENFILISSTLSQVGAGLLVLLRAGIELSSFGFLLLTTGLGLWVQSNFFIDFFAADKATSLFFARLSGAGLCFFVLGLNIFAVHYKSSAKLSFIIKLNILVALVFSTSATFSGIVLQDVDTSVFPVKVIQNPLGYLVLVTYIFGNLLVSFIYLFRRVRFEIDIYTKRQLRIIALGLFSLTLIATFTNVIAPLIFSDPTLTRIGPASTIIFTFFVAYVILRHRFFDIRLLIGRLVYYTTIGIIPYSIFFILVFIYQKLVGTVFNTIIYVISVPVAFIFVVAFNSINAYIRNQVTLRFINPGYNPLETNERYSNDLSLVLDIEKIADMMRGVVKRTVRPDFVAIILFSDAEKTQQAVVFSDDTKKASINENLFRLQQIFTLVWTTVGKYPFVVDEIDYERTAGIYRNTPNLADEGMKVMHSLGGKIAIPLAAGSNIRGVYIIGQKEADVPYSPQDVDFLKSIAISSSVAIERSLLYAEVQQFAETLQEKVDIATKELKKTNVELENALDQVQEARRKERDMIDVMGHELRTPISIVRNALAMLEREKQNHNGEIEKEKLDKYLDMGLESARREIRLIETLLSATKVDASRLQLLLTKVSLADVIRDGIEGQNALITEKGLELKNNAPAEEILVYSDRTRLQEVMDNFLSNAAKYTLKGSISIDAWVHEGLGWISISDTGMGIDEVDLKNLGKKFFRAKQYVGGGKGESGTEVVRPGGTGLGLYVTFELVRIMDGRLYINSKVGEGTSFTFGMPLYSDQPDKQYDQTFDAERQLSERQHIIINGQVPRPEKK